MEVLNLTQEMNAKPIRVNRRKDTRDWALKEAARGTGTPKGRPLLQAVALQPAPPCDHPAIGRCPFYDRCKATGEICSAFSKYVNSKFYLEGTDRIPKRHFNDLYRDDSLDSTESGSIIPSEARGTVHADTGVLEDPEPAQPGPDVRNPPQAGSTVHTDTHIYFIE